MQHAIQSLSEDVRLLHSSINTLTNEVNHVRSEVKRAQDQALEAKTVSDRSEHEMQTTFRAWERHTSAVDTKLQGHEGMLKEQSTDLKQLIQFETQRAEREKVAEKDASVRIKTKLSREAWIVPMLVGILVGIAGVAWAQWNMYTNMVNALKTEHQQSSHTARNP
jgi:ribosomal protein S19